MGVTPHCDPFRVSVYQKIGSHILGSSTLMGISFTERISSHAYAEVETMSLVHLAWRNA